jgi:glycosyltransferase involved in cell wall biosynthesis
MRATGTMDCSASGVANWVAAHSQGACRPGSVFLHAPCHAFQAPGGGENQLVSTGRWLERQGIAVRLFSPWLDRLEQGRLLHLFGMSREGLMLAREARARRVPVVLSPICWYEPRAILALEPGRWRKLLALGTYYLRSLAPALPGWRRELLNLADAVLPNSHAEADQLRALFGVPASKLFVAPNGVEPDLEWAGGGAFAERFGIRDFVFFAGRLEPRKNPLGLIRALAGTGYELVIAGSAPAGCAAYERACRSAGGDRVLWLGRLASEDPLLASAYRAARVFALPSWFETPGLAALEAALAGAAVVITPHGSTREYFGDLVRYARPDRPAEIRQAIEHCWNHGPDPRLRDRVRSRYLWPQTAAVTARVYDQIAA